MTRRLAAMLLLAPLIACDEAAPPPREEARPVRAATVERSTGGDRGQPDGTVQAEAEANLAFRIDGRMVERPGECRRRGALPASRRPAAPENEENGVRAAPPRGRGARAQLTEAENNYWRQSEAAARRLDHPRALRPGIPGPAEPRARRSMRPRRSSASPRRGSAIPSSSPT